MTTISHNQLDVHHVAVLLIFQAMDAAGKDGAIKHIMSGVNPQGCQVFSFKHPSSTELQHDFLWRTTRDLPAKNWKFSQADIDERQFWPQYLNAYESCLAATSTPESPWYIVPADDKENARIIISRIVLDHLRRLNMSLPKNSPQKKRELRAARRQLKDDTQI